MKIKCLLLIVIFKVAIFVTWAQNIDDLLEKENKNTNNEQPNGVTMVVDHDIPKSTSQGEAPATKQDSLQLVNDKWKNYLSGKNGEIQQIAEAIQQKESGKIKKEEIENFILQVNNLKKDFLNRKETNGLWQANDELDELRNQFDFACERELTKLNQLKETKGSGSSQNKFVYLGIILVVVMVGIPIFNQIKASTMVKKAKKMQELQAKLQKEEAEKQRLLSDDSNIVTLNASQL
ncbi:MAG: hypothetical protein FWF70_08205 [Bacteroidetes bacterium]|nr:hypothetical protein [Bacteroidota bacterium]MCL1968234.1 hypothetical protein [Bacteroidota bacterium]